MKGPVVPQPQAQSQSGFNDYEWMGNEDTVTDFDRRLEEAFMEQAWIEEFFSEMLEDEDQPGGAAAAAEGSQGEEMDGEVETTGTVIDVSEPIGQEESPDGEYQRIIIYSTLNPNAPEFVPKTPVVLK